MSSDPEILDIHGPLVPKAWSKLDRRTQHRVQFLLDQLIEIEAGARHSVQVVEEARASNHPLARFMFKAQLSYFHGCFMAGATGAQDVLRSLDLNPLADEIDARLKLPVGNKNLKMFLAEHRSTTGAHPSFDPTHVLRRVFRGSNLADKAVERQFRKALGDLMLLSRFTLQYLREQYPIAAAASDSWWAPRAEA